MKCRTRYAFSYLFQLIPLTSSIQLRDAIGSKLKGGPQDIDILHWTGRTALELIGQSGLGMSHDHFLRVFLMGSNLGYSFDNLDDSPPHEYSMALKNLMFVFIFRVYPATTNSHPHFL